MIYRFGSCELDTEAYELYREGQKVDIERRVFDILLYLLQNRGRLISRDELLDNCWPGMYVSDGTLTTSLGRVRRAIGQDQQKSDEIIKTVRGKGYRFLAEVSERSAAPTQAKTADAELTAPTATLKPIPATPPAAEPVAAQKPATTLTEMRQLTVLNCILCDTQTLLATHDMEEIHEIMQSYHLTAREVVEGFDGYLVHHLQDTILVYFGYPVAHEDDAQRAIRSGLQLLEAFASHPFSIAIGIHSGPVITGQTTDTTSLAPMTTGITPAIAEQLSRLSATRNAALIISEATAQLSTGHFDWQALEALSIPGQSDVIQCYQVLTDKQQTRLQVNEALHGLTPYIGRNAEQALLLERWTQARDGLGQTILLSGDAGIGKSRLLKTLAQHADITSHRWLECQCSPYHQNTPFYPLINLLVQLLQWQEEDDTEQRLQALEALLTTYQLPLSETVPLLANILSLAVPAGRYPPLPADAPQEHQQLLECLLTLLLELQQQTDEPLLFVVEDLHWVDPSTLEFIDLLITQVPTLAILLVLTTRPEFNPTWSVPALVTPLVLARFNSNQVEQMLLRITGGKALPDTVLQQIVEKTDGVPLFIEEITHSLLGSGQLQESTQSFELTQRFDPLTIPLNLKDSLMARLDRLGEAKEVARWGAVIGREFSHRLVAAVVPFDENVLQQYLNELLDSGLVHRRGLARRATYLFKHALIQDITYQSLLKRQRREFHQRIAEVLENAFPERVTHQPELLAQHHEAAGQFKSALHYWQQAGYRAVTSSALQEALAHFTKALALLRELPATESLLRIELNLQTSLGPIWVALKGQAAEEVETTYRRADELCQQLGETEQRFPILWGLWRLHNNRADLVTARALAQQLLDLTQQWAGNNRAGLLLEAHLAYASITITLGEFSSSDQHIQQALALYDHDQHHAMASVFGGWEPQVYGLTFASLTQWLLGYSQKSLQSGKQALELARQSSEPYTLVSTLHYSCVQQFLLRDIETVQKLAEELVELASEHGFPTRLYTGKVFLGWSLARQGDTAAGIALMQEGLAAHTASGNLLGRPVWNYILIDAYVDNQQYTEALSVLAETFAIIERTGEHTCLAELYRLQGECYYGQNNEQQAESNFQQALSIAREQQAKSLELRAAMSLARLWRTQHKQRDAHVLLSSMYDWFSEGFASVDLEDAKSLLEQLA